MQRFRECRACVKAWQMDEVQKKRRFEQLFVLAFPKVKTFALKLLGNEDDAEDIAQDVFVMFWNNVSLWEDGGMSDAYLYATARNSVFDLLRHRVVERTYQERERSKAAPLSSPDFYDELYAEELELIVKLALDNMPEQRRRVFVMSRQEGMTHQKIADELGISVRTVEHHVYLALRELKKIILFSIFLHFL